MANRESIVAFRELGSGGNGIVEEVWPSSYADSAVARKRLHPEDAGDEEIVSRFHREVRILQSLDHPNVIRILDSDLNHDDPYFLMELADYSLETEIKANLPSMTRIKEILNAVLDAIEYAHGQGVVHRDINSKNVLVMSDGRIVVCDFGLCVRPDRRSIRRTRTGTGRGTDGFAAPEQLRDAGTVDHRSDIYAIGGLVIELTTGENPLAADPEAVPNELKPVVSKCRQYSPDRRYQNIGQLRAALDVVWDEPVEFGPAVTQAIELLEGDNLDLDQIPALMLLYRRFPADDELLMKTMPLWTLEKVSHLSDDECTEIIEIIAARLPGRLPFEFLDVVGSFLGMMFTSHMSLTVRIAVIEKLITIGADGNRWSMGRKTASLVGGQLTRMEIDAVCEILRSNVREALWVDEYLREAARDPRIVEALDEIQRSAESRE